jgi:predicted HicB family RNase H-like nuclease
MAIGIGGGQMAIKKEMVNRHIRNIPEDVDVHLRMEAAKRRISINTYIVDVLTKEARRLKKKAR